MTEGFFTKWKKGIQMITPLQLITINLFSSLLIVIGVVIGLYATYTSEVYWLFTILCGSFFLSSTSLIGMVKQYWQLKELQVKLNKYKELNNEK